MSFAAQITALPTPFDPAKGRDIAASFADLPGDLPALIEGVAGTSPYLASLIEKEAGWLPDALRSHPRDALADAMVLARPDSRSALARTLRQAKRRVALLTALCDLGGIWPLETVTAALTQLADASVQAAIAFLVAETQARGKLPPTSAPQGGLFVLAMGKMGAHELNYSSDIDLIVLFDESLYPGEEYPEIRQAFIRITQQMARLLSDVTEDGYVFRTDLRLRPDPSVTPVCIGMGAAERYYESQGRTWERAAMIKARPCAGDIAAGEAFLDSLSPFIWRRHLDFAAIADAHDMRLRIREHKGLGGPINLAGHDVKLGRGGIREIEFFTQTRQLICGGRDPGLRLRQTKPGLDALVQGGWVSADLAAEFSHAYTEHRVLEHRIQMLDDAQTHIYPRSEESRQRVCNLYGQDDLGRFEAALRARFESIHQKVEDFFAHERGGGDEDTSLWEVFPDAEAARTLIEHWHNLPALRSDRSRAIFDRLAPELARRLSAAARPEEALEQFDRFLKGLPAGVQVLSLFEANPQILDLLVDICATAPRLAEYLGRNAQVLDAVLTADFYGPPATTDVLHDEVADMLARASDYEAQLDAARIWVREQTFRIGVHLLRGLCSPREAGAAYSRVAEAALQALLPAVSAAFAGRHGRIEGGHLAIIGMGKLGSGEMTASSDLDLILIYDAPDGAMSTGEKSLPVSTYFARLTQALINALTAPTAQGTLYSVDMRLRPSGRQGPVATSLRGFGSYQRDEAWTWEHLALTRARVVVGEPDLVAGIDQAIAEALQGRGDRAKILADVAEMRTRLEAAKASEGADPWEVKHGPGRMLDIEMALQTGRLLHPGIAARSPFAMIGPLTDVGFLSGDQAATLTGALDLLSTIQQFGRLALAEGFNPEKAGPGLVAILSGATGAADLAELQVQLAARCAEAAQVVGAVLCQPGP